MGWQSRVPKHDTKPELWDLRPIIVELAKKFHFTWFSQQGSDFRIWGLAVQVDGWPWPHGMTTTQAHDRYWELQALLEGLYPVRFKSHWVEKRPEKVKAILDLYLQLEQELG